MRSRKERRRAYGGLRDPLSGEELTEAEAVVDWCGQPTGRKGWTLTLKPRTFRAFRVR